MEKTMTRKEAVALLERYSNYEGMGMPNLAGCKEAIKVAVDALKEAFPELAESEDEKIRKELIDYLNGKLAPGEELIKQWIAYLEKQKDESERQFNLGIQAGREEVMYELEKEQKPTDVKDPFSNANFVRGYESGYADAKREQKPVEKPINWTELTWKDIVELEGIINNVHYEFRNGIGQESFGKEVLEKFREYKGDEYLEEWEQKLAEWSEEDETAFGDLMWCIEQARKSAKDENDMGNIWYAENWLKNRLKSLRPHWKPSEEQMRALCSVKEMPSVRCFRSELYSLHNDLQKL